jgi:hypothetical protein
MREIVTKIGNLEVQVVSGEQSTTNLQLTLKGFVGPNNISLSTEFREEDFRNFLKVVRMHTGWTGV